jgi:hypothetical protein
MDGQRSTFEQHVQEHSPINHVAEIWEFVIHTKKWWLLPVLFVLLLFALLIALGQTAAAPFIYTLF